MSWRSPWIRIERVDHVDIRGPLGPPWDGVILDLIKPGHLLVPDHRGGPGAALTGGGGLPWAKWFEKTATILSIASGLAVLILVVLLTLGRVRVGPINVGHALTVLSVTLVGGLVSIGGVKIVSISASLRRAQQLLALAGGCPWVPALDERARRQYEIVNPVHVGDPDFCQGCRLVDFHGRTVCRLSPLYQG